MRQTLVQQCAENICAATHLCVENTVMVNIATTTPPNICDAHICVTNTYQAIFCVENMREITIAANTTEANAIAANTIAANTIAPIAAKAGP